MPVQPLVDLVALARLAGLALLLAMLPLSWWWLRQRGADPRARMAALTALTMFLTFDLVVFGAFTRLTDSGLGCPDWPGCYGAASPLGAQDAILAAQSALPSGPVTWTKAWIEMIHRYLAMTVGVLILALAAFSWRVRTVPGSVRLSRWWPTFTLAWVVVQGLFGKYTVTLKLYPVVVTLHLLGGLALLALLALQHQALRPRATPIVARSPALAVAAMVLLLAQVALGGWVSSNYAVLACAGFPQCNGQWWPAMDLGSGFTLLRALGQGPDGAGLPFDALVGIHMAHRLLAVVASLALGGLVLVLWRAPGATTRRWGLALAGLVAAQWASGLSNVVLGWPLAAALAHSAGAAALVLLMALLLARVKATGSQARGQGATA